MLYRSLSSSVSFTLMFSASFTLKHKRGKVVVWNVLMNYGSVSKVVQELRIKL